MTTGSIHIAMTSDCGLKRKNNQDTGLTHQGVYVVCDGMGGGMGGEQASQLAVRRFAELSNVQYRNRELISETLEDAQQQVLQLGQQLGGVAGTTITGLILPAKPSTISSADTSAAASTDPAGSNAEAAAPSQYDIAETPTAGPDPSASSDGPIDDSTLDGSGSYGTDAAADEDGDTDATFSPTSPTVFDSYCVSQQVYVVNIGDSRTYHLSPKNAFSASQESSSSSSASSQNTPVWDPASLTRITRDHSQRQEAIDSGLMTPEAAAVLVPRNIITQCLGDPEGIAPDIYVADLTGRYIICSDGLYSEVPDHLIASIAAAHASPRAAVDALVQAALQAGGHDNITVIVVDMPTPEHESHAFSAFRLGDGEDIGAIEDTTLQTLRTIRSIQP
ncbi:PP2C family protein-serine/threonine phosphatase [Bifidobacterium colobi]|uniref:PP2C family protein-serine/threonine phosphatase n=1 Tax=Bifidobacterium colobi TaxID=2809026 RepID=UPI001F0A7D9D|nr:serine/threonine-protein phosphatase [Bifidobacterium colobi]